MLCYEANFFFAVLLVDERIIKWDVFYEIKVWRNISNTLIKQSPHGCML